MEGLFPKINRATVNIHPSGGMQMLLYPRSDFESDDERLAQLHDPQLAKRLRKANPKFFTHSRTSIAKILALAGIVSLVSGYFMEPVVIAPYRDREAMITTHVRHVAPAPLHVPAAHHAAPVPHAVPVVHVTQKAVIVQTEPLPQPQPKKQVQRRARVLVAPQPDAQAQNEERFWLKAQAEARAKDRMRAKALAVTAAAEKAAEDRAPAEAPAKAPVDSEATPRITVPQPPVNAPRVPSPVSEPWPTLPGGGPCTPGRGPILVGGHGLGGAIINAVLQNVIPVPHTRPFGRP
jgi:hypothetical protein